MLTLLAGLVRRTRQHHAIEHATIHLLAARFPQRQFSGFSDPAGFTIYGDVSTFDVQRAVGDALLRLQAGEQELAIHPNCGTNLAASGVLVTLVALLAANGRRGPLERFSVTLSLILLALAASRPLGFWLQEYTTLADVADRWVAEVRPLRLGAMPAHRVLFDSR